MVHVINNMWYNILIVEITVNVLFQNVLWNWSMKYKVSTGDRTKLNLTVEYSRKLDLLHFRILEIYQGKQSIGNMLYRQNTESR